MIYYIAATTFGSFLGAWICHIIRLAIYQYRDYKLNKLANHVTTYQKASLECILNMHRFNSVANMKFKDSNEEVKND